MGKIILNKNEKKIASKEQTENADEVLEEVVGTIQEDENEGLHQLFENKSRGYRRTNPSNEAERSVRHEENVNVPSNQNSHGKTIHKNSNTKRFCHFFNNSTCSYNERCKFLHEKAPFCKYDGRCDREKCMFQHRKSPRFLERGFQQYQTLYQARPAPWQWMNQQTVRPIYQQGWGVPQMANMVNLGHN